MDIDRIREDNERRTDVERKAGLIIWSGRTLAILRVCHDEDNLGKPVLGALLTRTGSLP